MSECAHKLTDGHCALDAVEYCVEGPCPHFTPRREWISVKDHLPEKYGCYFVCIKAGGIVPTTLVDLFDPTSGWLIQKNNVTHWMPLPEPPKEEE